MKHLSLALLLLVLAVWPAHAQPVTVIGPITPGDCAAFSSTTILKDAGFVCSGGFGLIIGTTAITGGTSRGILFDNAGVLGNGPSIDGIDANVLNVQTSTYAVSATDCGSTIVLGGSALYALTVGAASGFPSTCTFNVVNSDTTRAKTMTVNGITFPNGGFLWPAQSTTLKNESNTWAVSTNPGRWRLAASTTFNVDPVNGSNSSDCLGSQGTSGACATINQVYSNLQNDIDTAAQSWIVQTPTAPGTTVAPFTLSGPVVGDKCNGNILGNTTTPTNVVINGVGGSAAFFQNGACLNNFAGFSLKSTGNHAVQMLTGAVVSFGLMDWGGANAANADLYSTRESIATITQSATLSGSAGNWLQSTHGGHIRLQGANTYSLTANITVGANCLLFSSAGGEIVETGGGSWSNGAFSVTGCQYDIQETSSIEWEGLMPPADNAVGGSVLGSMTLTYSHNGPTCFWSSTKLTCAGGTAGFAFNNQSNSVTNWNIADSGHMYPGAQAAVPALSSCGTTPGFAGVDNVGTIVPGSGASACTLTFGTGWTSRPFCLVTDEAGSVPPHTIGITTLVLTTAMAAHTYNYICQGQVTG